MDAKRPQWTPVRQCPACGEVERHDCGVIDERYCLPGAENMPARARGIRLYECARCALVYKSPVPDSLFLADLLERRVASKWVAPSECADEINALRRLCGKQYFDLLDVGAAGGGLLAACAAAGVSGRRSALDVVRFPGMERSLNGEFIEGVLDSPTLSWSGKPYDVVTAFDVFEHLNNPFVAFSNLRALVKPDGLVLIETGNAASAWPLRFGLNRWWNVQLVDRHVFWSHRSLQYSAASQIMEILHWEELRHGSQQRLRSAQIARRLLKFGLYCKGPDPYATLASTFARDHLRVALRRN